MMKTIFALTLLALPSLTAAQGVRYAVQNRTGGLGGGPTIIRPETYAKPLFDLKFS